MHRDADARGRLVVHLIPETIEAGAENQARYLIEGLLDRGSWDIELVYFSAGRAHESFASLGIPMYQVPRNRRIALDLMGRARGVHALYRDRPPAILHSWLDEANLVGALAARRWPSSKLVISQRCAGAAYRDVPLWPWAIRLIRRYADQAVSNSTDGMRFLRGLGYSPRQLSLIPNGFPEGSFADAGGADRARARGALGLDRDAPTIGFVGRADGMKDFPNLFSCMERVWESFPDAYLVLIGPTSEGLRQLGLRVPERAVALGWKPSAAQWMRAFDVLALSSWTEGRSNAVDEALLAGIPVATTAVGDHLALVERTGGRVVPTRRPDLLGNAVVELLQRPPRAEDVRREASRVLGMSRVVDATERVYRQLLDGSR